MATFVAIEPTEQVFTKDGKLHVLGKQDGLRYRIYTVLLHQEHHCKDADEELFIESCHISDMRGGNGLRAAEDVIEDFKSSRQLQFL